MAVSKWRRNGNLRSGPFRRSGRSGVLIGCACGTPAEWISFRCTCSGAPTPRGVGCGTPADRVSFRYTSVPVYYVSPPERGPLQRFGRRSVPLAPCRPGRRRKRCSFLSGNRFALYRETV
ncbi:hypothetical protein TNIN_222021 [Trichonephila inaurata madagascariensis]|uniref:Uncharacterized protein n=1 Tax=Trichonephila inaurata madagascariensis TaxID=2747483 RepID=A0A8X6XW11_9ARAC|nr:hypothetical protein TNIN_222021 [Trichonephila inaurata madagascariensis]